jgi:indole-3-glycerol phosphate synthase
MSVLEQILKHKRTEIADRKRRTTESELHQQAAQQDPPRGLRRSLTQPGVRVIAEVKRVSPARGALKIDANAADLASRYANSGAAGISVLTDERFFAGRDEDLREAHRAVQIPILRKDFILEPYQVLEARAIGADAVLLIVRALSDQQLVDLRLQAESLGMDALVEVHDSAELERAVRSGATLVGINNRDLATLEVDVANTFAILPGVPAGVTVVSESGIRGPADIERLLERGVRAVLVGEVLVTAADPGMLLRDMIAVGAAR